MDRLTIDGYEFIANVLLPPGYDEPGNAVRYPVIYLFPGGNQNRNAWPESGGLKPSPPLFPPSSRRSSSSRYGLGGRPRTVSDPVERARKAITRRIKESIDRIEREHRALGNHLRHSIKTGTFCSYVPESPTSWST